MRARLEIAVALHAGRDNFYNTALGLPVHEEASVSLPQVGTLGMRLQLSLRKTCEKAQVCAHDWKSLLRFTGTDDFYNSALGLP